MRCGGTPNLRSTPGTSSVSLLIVLTSVTYSLTSWARSLSLVETIVLKLLLAAAPRERRDHIIGFDAGNFYDRPAQRPHRFMNRLDLAPEVVRHCGPICLVFGKQVVAKRLTLGVENARDVLRLHLLSQDVQHRNEAAKRARRLAARCA